MKYYKNSMGNVFAYDADGSQDHVIPSDQTSITESEASVLRSPLLTKFQVWGLIKSERDRRMEIGGYKVDAKWFHSDQKSRIQQFGLVMLGSNIPAGLQWKTMDGTFVIMTQSLMQQIVAAAVGADEAIFTVAESHRSAMEARSDPANYDFLTGWPAIFGE